MHNEQVQQLTKQCLSLLWNKLQCKLLTTDSTTKYREHRYSTMWTNSFPVGRLAGADFHWILCWNRQREGSGYVILPCLLTESYQATRPSLTPLSLCYGIGVIIPTSHPPMSTSSWYWLAVIEPACQLFPVIDGEGLPTRVEPIVLISVMIILCCTAQEMFLFCLRNVRIKLKNCQLCSTLISTSDMVGNDALKRTTFTCKLHKIILLCAVSFSLKNSRILLDRVIDIRLVEQQGRFLLWLISSWQILPDHLFLC